MRYLLCLLVTLPLAVPAQAPEPSIKTTTSEVLLDFVARDKSSHVIRDLRPDEVQVLEDGVPQTMKHFEFYDGRAEAPTAPATASATDASASRSVTVNELRDISVVSIVIANLDPRGRKLTQEALADFVKEQLKPSIFVGVYNLGMTGLNTRQQYTNDGAKITAAVQSALDSATTDQLNALDQAMLPDYALGSASGRFASQDFPTSNGDESSDPSVGGTDVSAGVNTTGMVGQPPAGPAGAGISSYYGLIQTVSRIMGTRWDQELQDVYTDSARFLGPLNQLVAAQAGIPGRKVILLFAAGLPISSNTDELLNNVISNANRANVSIYAVDPRGFTDGSELAESKRLLMAAAVASQQQMTGPMSSIDQTVRPDAVRAGEIAEASIHADTHGNLLHLAESTGGAMLPASLDMREPLRDALEDVRTHYEVTYAPINTATDGSFRKIEVKVLRPGVKVFAREGYYALPVLNGQQLYPFEVATMKAINTTPDLHQFDFHSATLEFRPGPGQNQYAYVFQAPTHDLEVVSDKQWAKVHVCVTALIKDDKGQVVDKISKDIPYDVPIDKKAALEKGIVSFAAPFELPQGHYTVETAAVDRQSMKASVSRTDLTVPPPARFAMSDVTVARRVDGVQGLANADDPLEAHGGKVTPDLSDTVVPDATGAVKFYAVAYAPALSDAPVLMNIEVWQGDKLVMRSPGSRIPTDPRGAASVLAAVPAAKLGAGHFEARVSFQYNGEKLTRKVDFTLAEAPQVSSK
jgi:VWFA-related protein